MKHPLLYSFRRCPYAMRARMGLYSSGITIELREIVLRDKPEHMLQISPKATIPVLQLTDGTVIDESLDIMIWALGRQDPDEWLDADEKQTKVLIKQNDTDFKYALDRYKYPNRYKGEDTSNAFDNAAYILKEWNERIEKNGALISDRSTLADYAIFPFIRQFRNVDTNRFESLQLNALSKWLNAHLDNALFESIMNKYDPWKPDDTPILFGQNS